MTPLPRKQCARVTCGKLRPITSFSRDNARKDHRDSVCKMCRAVERGRHPKKPPGSSIVTEGAPLKRAYYREEVVPGRKLLIYRTVK